MYITALSHYCRDIYPDNSSSSFINNLAEPIHLQSGKSYEIALASFSYNANHVTESSEDLEFTVFDWKYYHKDTKLWGLNTEMKIDHAILNNADDLCTVMNSLIWATIDRFRIQKKEFFTYGKNRRVWVNFDEDTYITIMAVI